MPWDSIVVSLEVGDGQSTGFLVDEVLGVQQVVLRPLDGIDATRTPFSGGAILGDGRVSMVVDVDRLGTLM
jgi:two-component system, chemotaxis family, sensor kinase CheA